MAWIRSSSWAAVCGVALGLSLAACGDRAPAEPGTPPSQQTSGEQTSAAQRSAAGRSVGVRDPGRLRRELAPRLSRSLSDLPITRTAGGGGRIALNGRMSSVHIVERRADGSFDVDCVTSTRQLDARLARSEASR